MKKFIKKFSGFSYKYFLDSDDNNSLLSRTENNKYTEFRNVKFPKNALVELTAGCNHSCVFCTNPRMSIAANKLDIEIYKKFIIESKKLGLEEVGFYMRGEPLLDNRLSEFIEIAKSAGIDYIYITTNGAKANIEKMKKLISCGLNSIKFSINAASRKKYREVHGQNDFDLVVKNLIDLNEYREKNNINLKIISSFVVTKFTQDEIDLYKRIFLPLVDDMKILGVHGQAGQSLEELKRLESDELTAPFPTLGNAKPCGMLWDTIHLTQDGLLTLCCVDYDNNLTYANLKNESVESAWNNNLINNMRERHIKNNLEGSLCHNCVYGTKDSFEPISSHHINTKNRKQIAIEKSKKSVVDRIKTLATTD